MVPGPMPAPASANFPALLLALTWRRFNTAGALTGVIFGVVSSIFLVIVSPKAAPAAGEMFAGIVDGAVVRALEPSQRQAIAGIEQAH